MNKCRLFALTALVLSSLALPAGEEKTPAYRTDQNADESLEWFQLVEGEFPPPNSAHHISGELIQVNHLERTFILRADRTDDHRRSHFDLPLAAAMLPFGSVHYHGSPAALEDIPLGTHLHGQFYLRDPEDETPPVEGWHGRVTPEADFNRCFRLEDDFSFHERSGKEWRIDEVNLEEKKLTATLFHGETAEGEARSFDLQSSTRVWKGACVAALEDLAPGQRIQLNLTWATLYGPGRLLEIWTDPESRETARRYQREKHLIHQRQRGLAGWIDEVDNHERIVTITFFGGIDPSLLEEFRENDSVGVAVARSSLMTFDPVNDRKRGPILEVLRPEPEPGSSGMRIRVRPDLLLEGYRPTRIVRVYPSSWPVIALPKEHQYFGRY